MSELVVGSCVDLSMAVGSPAPRVVALKRADRELLKRCRDAITSAVNDTAETLDDPDRRLALVELLADIAEELGVKEIESAPKPEEEGEFITVNILGRGEKRVRVR